jgi:hypothetical protein
MQFIVEYWNAFRAAFAAELAKNIALTISAFFALGGINGFYYYDPFYHPGWILLSSKWLFLLFTLTILCGITIASAIFFRYGLVIVLAIAALTVTGFFYLYMNPEFSSDSWLLYVWLLHLVAAVFAIGSLFGMIGWLIRGGAQRLLVQLKRE